MKKLKAEIYKFTVGLYVVNMSVGRRGNIETANYKNNKNRAMRAFIYMCRQLGIDRDKWEFVDKTGE